MADIAAPNVVLFCTIVVLQDRAGLAFLELPAATLTTCN